MKLIDRYGYPIAVSIVALLCVLLVGEVVFFLGYDRWLIYRCETKGGHWQAGDPAVSYVWVGTVKTGFSRIWITTYPNARCVARQVGALTHAKDH